VSALLTLTDALDAVLLGLFTLIGSPPILLANLLALVGFRVMSRHASGTRTDGTSSTGGGSPDAGASSSGGDVVAGPVAGAQQPWRRWTQVILVALLVAQVVYLVKHYGPDADRTRTTAADSHDPTTPPTTTSGPATGTTSAATTAPTGGGTAPTSATSTAGGAGTAGGTGGGAVNGNVVPGPTTTIKVTVPGGSGSTPHAGPSVPPSTSAAPVSQPQAFASVGLSTQASVTATLYFGRLGAVMSWLSGTVHFNTDAAYATAHPGQCVSTVVFGSVSGSAAVVYAQSLGGGWGGAERAPSQSLAADNGHAHQQLIVPPWSAGAGTSWTGSALLVVDGSQQYTSSPYTLVLDRVSGSTQTWTVAGRTQVECTL
jgi:hypothetical protein